MSTDVSTRPADAAAAARTLGSPAVVGAPEHPGDIPTVEQVDWTGMIVAALGPTTSIDLPLPQLLLKMAETLAALTENGEHLKGFVHGQGDELTDAMHSVDERIKARNKRRTDTEGRVATLEVAMERLAAAEARIAELEAALTAPDDASKVQRVDV